MNYWVVKGRPSRNDLDQMLAPGRVERWVTKRPPRDWAAGDGVFFWKGAPALELMGLGRIDEVSPSNVLGDAFFKMTYLTAPLEAALTIEELRRDDVVGNASFLKSGAAGTVFPLSPDQARQLLALLRDRNPGLRSVEWGPRKASLYGEERVRALSVRQPWAELIMRGAKTVEVRSRKTHVRGRVHIYASLGDVHVNHQVRIRNEHGLDIEALSRGVIVGTVEIVGCRPLVVGDSKAAAVPVAGDTTDFGWLLSRPERATSLVKPTKHPQPVFFTPF